jgi:4-oxalocrotonate tautomerase
MPVATLQIVAGRDPERKRQMVHAVAEAIAATLDAPLDTVRVIVQEIPAELWCSGSETIAERRARQAAQQGVKA